MNTFKSLLIGFLAVLLFSFASISQAQTCTPDCTGQWKITNNTNYPFDIRLKGSCGYSNYYNIPAHSSQTFNNICVCVDGCCACAYALEVGSPGGTTIQENATSATYTYPRIQYPQLFCNGPSPNCTYGIKMTIVANGSNPSTFTVDCL